MAGGGTGGGEGCGKADAGGPGGTVKAAACATAISWLPVVASNIVRRQWLTMTQISTPSGPGLCRPSRTIYKSFPWCTLHASLICCWYQQ
jgi:hypothetical protein